MLARASHEQTKPSGGGSKISIDLGTRKLEEEKTGAKFKVFAKDAIIIDDENQGSLKGKDDDESY